MENIMNNEKLAKLDTANNVQCMLDYVFNGFDDLIIIEDWVSCKKFLLEVDVNSRSIVCLIGILSITLNVKNVLGDERKEFYDKVYKRITVERANDINGLLDGLE